MDMTKAGITIIHSRKIQVDITTACSLFIYKRQAKKIIAAHRTITNSFNRW